MRHLWRTCVFHAFYLRKAVEHRLDAIAMGFHLDCLDGVSGESEKIVTQFSECVSQVVNLKMNFRETTCVPRANIRMQPSSTKLFSTNPRAKL